MSDAQQITEVIDAQLARIRGALKDRILTKVAEATGLHVNTIRNIAKNEEQSFSLSTIKKLSSYLFPSEA